MQPQHVEVVQVGYEPTANPLAATAVTVMPPTPPASETPIVTVVQPVSPPTVRVMGAQPQQQQVTRVMIPPAPQVQASQPVVQVMASSVPQVHARGAQAANTVQMEMGAMGASMNARAFGSVGVTKPVSSVNDADYPGGEADVIRANESNSLSWEELVSVVTVTKDTIFAFDKDATMQLFRLLDADGGGSITLDEVLSAQQKPAVQAFLQESRQKTFRRLFDTTNVSNTIEAFKKIDSDHSGTIDEKEVRASGPCAHTVNSSLHQYA